ncbi:hypothetical protein CTAYLR_004641, partial [Chrysophaeum taylorii]
SNGIGGSRKKTVNQTVSEKNYHSSMEGRSQGDGSSDTDGLDIVYATTQEGDAEHEEAARTVEELWAEFDRMRAQGDKLGLRFEKMTERLGALENKMMANIDRLSLSADSARDSEVVALEADDEVDQVIWDVHSLAYASYYYRTIEMLVAGDGTMLPSSKDIGWIAHVLVAAFLIFLQIFAMQSVWQSNWLFFKWSKYDDDSEAFPQGEDGPSNWHYMINLFGDRDNYSYEGVPIMTMISLFFVVVMLALQIRPEIEKCKMEMVAFVEPEPITTEKAKHDLNIERSPPRDKIARLLAAYFLRVLKLCLLLSFYDLTMIILGASDGPVELLMSSLALLFVLDVDNFVGVDLLNFGLVFDIKKDDSHKRLTLPQRQARSTQWITAMIANARRASARPGGHRRVAFLHRNSVHFRTLVSIILTFSCAFAGQRLTSHGKYMIYDDDADAEGRFRVLRAIFMINRFVILAFLLIEVHVCSLVVRRRLVCV